MAKEIGTNYFEREDGDACPRGSENMLEKGEKPCRGSLYREYNHQAKEDLMRCKACDYTFGVRYKVPMMPDDRKGRPPGWMLMPEELVIALAAAIWDAAQEDVVPDPREREPFEEMSASGASYMKEARRVLGKCWPEIASWFQEFFGVEDPEAERALTARRAIEEIAIPTLERYEEKFDTPDKPRAALEATLNAR
jgi:hypothetical protein